MRHEGNEVYKGVVAEFDLDHNFAVVDVHTFLDVQVGPFLCALESLPHGEVIVVGHGVSGEILAKSVVLNGDSRVSKDDEDLNCKISEVHLHDDMSIFILFLLCMEAIKMIVTFLLNSCSMQLHFFQM